MRVERSRCAEVVSGEVVDGRPMTPLRAKYIWDLVINSYVFLAMNFKVTG